MLKIVCTLLVFGGTTACHGGISNNSAPDTSPSPDQIRQLFAAIDVGALRADVEQALGPPLCEHTSGEWGILTAPDHCKAWYLQMPALSPVDSPYAPGAIGLCFVDGHVVEKTLDPQLPAD
jgi:hypothetical protein